MLKRLSVALAALFAFVSIAQGAGTIPGFSLTPQPDLTGKFMPGCKLYVIQAGTVSTPQNSYQDSGLTLLQPNPLTCDASARLPQFFVADGTIKLRLTSSTGVQVFVGDNLLVVGASSGGGGGSPVDPTTVLATGDYKFAHNTGPITGFVRCNGRTIGSATSGATERANADTSALYAFLWGVDANLAVTGGRGVSGAADFAANKSMALPDCRGRAFAGLDDMGNSAAGRLTATYFGATGPCTTTLATVLGAACGGESQTLALAQLPTGITTSGSNSITVTGPIGGHTVPFDAALSAATSTGGVPVWAGGAATNSLSFSGSNTIVATSNNTSGSAHPNVQPTILVTTYIKL